MTTMDGQVSFPLVRLPAGPPRPDPEDPTWWKAWANCRGVPASVFYPTDLSRTGPQTREMRQNAVAAVRNGHAVEAVADEYGLEVRLLRYWLTLSARQLVQPVRKTTERPGIEAAKSICRGCEVRLSCLEYAITTRETDGVWGGMDPEERKLELRRRRQRLAS